MDLKQPQQAATGVHGRNLSVGEGPINVKEQIQQKRHFDEFEAAAYLSLTVSTLRDWRIRKRGPVYAKFGKAVRYPVAELERFAEASRVRMAA